MQLGKKPLLEILFLIEQSPIEELRLGKVL